MSSIFQFLTDEQQELYDGILLMMTSGAAVPVDVFCEGCPNYPHYADEEGNLKAGNGLCRCRLNPYRLAVD